MNIRVIGDVHHRLSKVKKILKTSEEQQVDKTIWLGDWFDSFDENSSHAETAKFLIRRMIEFPKDTFIIGNHDIQYITDAPNVRCSGFNLRRWQELRSMLSWDVVRRFKVTTVSDGIVYSHAGFVEPFEHLIPSVIGGEGNKAIKSLFDNKSISYLFAAGYAVGGTAKDPGPVWTRPSEFYDKPKLNQIFGHTVTSEPKLDLNQESGKFRLSLDTVNEHYAIVTEKEKLVTIYNADGTEHSNIPYGTNIKSS